MVIRHVATVDVAHLFFGDLPAIGMLRAEHPLLERRPGDGIGLCPALAYVGDLAFGLQRELVLGVGGVVQDIGRQGDDLRQILGQSTGCQAAREGAAARPDEGPEALHLGAEFRSVKGGRPAGELLVGEFRDPLLFRGLARRPCLEPEHQIRHRKPFPPGEHDPNAVAQLTLLDLGKRSDAGASASGRRLRSTSPAAAPDLAENGKPVSS